MTSNELIQRYLLGLATADEVQELELRLASEDGLQDEFLFQAEVDSFLRQELQMSAQQLEEPKIPLPRSTSTKWKWASGISTIAASVLLLLFFLNLPPQQTALAYPSLGQFEVNIAWTEQNIWVVSAGGDLNSIRTELQKQISVNALSEDRLTPLHVATLFNRRTAIELLLSEGADVSLRDAEGNTALQMAAFLGHTDVVRLLLAVGADPAVQNDLGFNAADLVAITWSSDLEEYYRSVEQVLNLSLDLERIRTQRPKILRLLTAASPEASQGVPTISLWQAAITGNTSAVERHVLFGTDLNQKEDFAGSTPLSLSAIFGQYEVANILIDAGADLELQSNDGSTPLHQACFFCRPEIVELLLESGADVNNINHRELTPLGVVSAEFNAEIEGVYRHVFGSLKLEFDPQHIRQTRARIANMIRSHIKNKN